MRLLIDTDILIDVALDRVPHVEDSAKVLRLVQSRPGSACIAWHTASNFYYLVAGAKDRDDPRTFLYELSRFVSIAPTTTDHLRVAAKLPVPDFEDAMQASAAIAWNADYIVTRNAKDFERSPVPVIEPVEAVRMLSS